MLRWNTVAISFLVVVSWETRLIFRQLDHTPWPYLVTTPPGHTLVPKVAANKHEPANFICLCWQLDPESADKSDFDWWSKYYCSIGDDQKTQKAYVEGNHDMMVVYEGELEDNFNRCVYMYMCVCTVIFLCWKAQWPSWMHYQLSYGLGLYTETCEWGRGHRIGFVLFSE